MIQSSFTYIRKWLQLLPKCIIDCFPRCIIHWFYHTFTASLTGLGNNAKCLPNLIIRDNSGMSTLQCSILFFNHHPLSEQVIACLHFVLCSKHFIFIYCLLLEGSQSNFHTFLKYKKQSIDQKSGAVKSFFPLLLGGFKSALTPSNYRNMSLQLSWKYFQKSLAMVFFPVLRETYWPQITQLAAMPKARVVPGLPFS